MMDSRHLIAGSAALILAGGGCAEKAPQGATRPAATSFATLTPVRTLAEEPLSIKTGDSLVLPSDLTDRTILSGAAPSLSSTLGVIGSVVDVPGTVVSNRCVAAALHIQQIPPGSVLKTAITLGLTATSKIHFNEIIERQKSAQASYLAFSVSMGKDDRAEVLIEDVAEQTIENFDRDVDSTKLGIVEARPLASGACGRYVIARVLLTAVKYRVYKKNRAEASILGILAIGGKNYYSYSKQTNELRVGIVLRPIRYPAQPGKAGRSPLAPFVIELLP